MNGIETDTPLLPHVVADAVIGELARWADADIDINLADRLAEKADRIYANNETFRSRLRGKAGREYLYCFMRHWLTAELKGHVGALEIPYWFANGEPIGGKGR